VNAQDLQRARPSTAQQGEKARGEGEAEGRPLRASSVNEVWAVNFVHDPLATGRKIRVLTVVDAFSRFSPVLVSRFSYRHEDVVRPSR